MGEAVQADVQIHWWRDHRRVPGEHGLPAGSARRHLPHICEGLAAQASMDARDARRAKLTHWSGRRARALCARALLPIAERNREARDAETASRASLSRPARGVQLGRRSGVRVARLARVSTAQTAAAGPTIG